jgi:hypothetical protein
MEKSFIFPSVFEEDYRDFEKVADSFLEAMRIVNFKDKSFIVGELALKEGHSPHKFLNSSAEDIDYQLLGLIGLIIATQGTYNKLILTVGFPFTTYQPYRSGAIEFFKRSHEIEFDTRTLGGTGTEKVSFTVQEVDVMSEIEGCVSSIRNGPLKEKDNFLIASLGYGTFELALSSPGGLIYRTTHSAPGLMYVVNRLKSDLEKKYYLSLLTEQQLERAFQRGSMIINRRDTDLRELRSKALRSYYNEVISPSIRKKISDEDFYRAQKIYLVGGGAMYNEIVEFFKEEFEGVLKVIVNPDPNLAASKGYCQHSVEMANSRIKPMDEKSSYTCVGLDLGNNNTVITVNNEFFL